MDRINGVSITVSMDGNVLEVQDDGYLGKLVPGQALIEVYVLPGCNIYGFTVDGKKNVVPKKDWALLARPPKEGKHYKARVQIKTSLEGVYHTEYSDNNLRLLELNSDGNVRIWEIALISQGGDFFVTIQQTYTVCCYSDGQKVVCPRFDEKWPSIVKLLGKLLGDKVKGLAPVKEYQPEPEPTVDDLAPNTARVLWFNLARGGIGAITTPEGEARVYWKQVTKRNRLAFLVPGEVVRYESLGTPFQTRARPTAFKKQAVGVKPL